MSNIFSNSLESSFKSISNTALEFSKSDSFKLGLRRSLESMRSQLESVSAIATEDSLKIFQNLIEITDSLSDQLPDDNIMVDISDCYDVIFTGINVTTTDFITEQQVIYEEIVPPVNNGNTFLTFDRLIAIATLLISFYSVLHARLQEKSQEKVDRRKREISEKSLRIEQSRLETEKAVLNALEAIAGKMETLTRQDDVSD